MTREVLVATLGTEPQVVTLAADLLAQQGCALAEVIVVHTAGSWVEPAVVRLREELGRAGAVTSRFLEVTGPEGPVDDILTEDDVAALLRTLYRVVRDEKKAGGRVHLSIAGGRKPMAVYGMLVAQLLFDEGDRLWHLLSEGWRPGDRRVMHAQPGDRIWLVPVPVLRWSSVSPVATELALSDDPWEAIGAQRQMRAREEQQRQRDFVQHWLTPAEREVTRLASQGLDNAAVANRLGKKEKTVANQLTSVYDKLHEWRGYRTDVPVSRAVLVAEFAEYFRREGR
jgi:CRISPR-associated protein Csx14